MINDVIDFQQGEQQGRSNAKKKAIDAIIEAFGKNPIGCDNAIVISIKKYNEMVKTINNI